MVTKDTPFNQIFIKIQIQNIFDRIRIGGYITLQEFVLLFSNGYLSYNGTNLNQRYNDCIDPQPVIHVHYQETCFYKCISENDPEWNVASMCGVVNKYQDVKQYNLIECITLL